MKNNSLFTPSDMTPLVTAKARQQAAQALVSALQTDGSSRLISPILGTHVDIGRARREVRYFVRSAMSTKAELELVEYDPSDMDTMLDNANEMELLIRGSMYDVTESHLNLDAP